MMVCGVPCEAAPTVEQQVNELVVYLQGDYEIPLRELRYPKESCYECHEHGSYEEIVEMTAELEETVGANPHASHYGEMDCRLCHQMHKESPLIKGWYSCRHAGTFESCSTCHGTAAGGNDD